MSVTISSGEVDGSVATLSSQGTIVAGGTSTIVLSNIASFVNSAEYGIRLITPKGNNLSTMTTYTGP
ncbi:MAG: hypothetical protein ACLQO7_05580 [Candidatus Bathyarchaeia archaeon]